MQEQLTTEQKIDIIYDKIIAREKKERTAIFIKWWVRVFMILYIAYFFMFALPSLMDNFKTSITPDISGITLPEGSLDKITELLNR